MNIEIVIFISSIVLISTIQIFFPYSQWGAVSAQKKQQSEMDTGETRTKSIMWNH